MSLHHAIQNYINELQTLLAETDEQVLLDKAREQWGQNDVRFEVLEQFFELELKFEKPADPPDAKPDPEENKSVR